MFLFLFFSYFFVSFINSHLCIQDVSDESSVLVSSAQGCEHVPPVDVVVTWVNGSDPAFIESLRLHYNRFTNSIKVILKGFLISTCISNTTAFGAI